MSVSNASQASTKYPKERNAFVPLTSLRMPLSTVKVVTILALMATAPTIQNQIAANAIRLTFKSEG